MRSELTANMNWNLAIAAAAVFFCMTLTSNALGDCAGPPTTPVIRVSITACAVSQRYDSTLRLTGSAHQVLTFHHASATESATDEFHAADVALVEDTFWITVSNEMDCETFLQTADDIWFYGDVCNDTGQNVPDLQLIELWPEIQKVVKDKLN